MTVTAPAWCFVNRPCLRTVFSLACLFVQVLCFACLTSHLRGPDRPHNEGEESLDPRWGTRGPGDPSGRPGAGLPQRSTVRFACSCVCAPCNSSAGLPRIIILRGFRHLLGMWVPPPARSTYGPETRRPAGAWPFASSRRRGRRGELRSGMWVPPPCPGSSAARRRGERLVPGLGLLLTPGAA